MSHPFLPPDPHPGRTGRPRGRCILVGAGPGDSELLTLKALKAIQSATVLLVDALVHPDIVALAPQTARVIHVGKRGGCKSTPQAFIERLMLAAARRGETVVRLKGGDPMIFGRGGEEAGHLRAAGVAVEVVNGITAGLAAVTALGAPLTQRGRAHGVMFITGHRQEGGAAVDWQQLAATAHAARLTLVIYMGMGHVRHIGSQLLAGGLPADTPAAVIENASLAQQRQVLTTLENLAACVASSGLGSPAVLVLGDVLQGVAQLARGRPGDVAAPAADAVATACCA